MTREEHHRTTNMFIIVGAAAIIIGMVYWWTTASNTPVTSSVNNPSSDLRAQVAAILRSSSVQVSQQEVSHVAAQLSQSKVVVTDAQKQAVANALRGN